MATVSHTPPPTRDTTPGPLRLAGQFFTGVLWLLIVLLLGYIAFGYFGTESYESADAKRADERRKILADRVTEDYHYLHDKPAWFKQDKGLVRVPIDEAMAMTAKELAAVKPHAAYSIASSPPQNNGAPTSPDKGFDPKGDTGTNPPASNPTTGHPVPTPAPAATPVLPANVPTQAATTPAPGTMPSPAATAPTPAAPAAPLPTPTPAPAAAATPVPVPTVTPGPTGPGKPAGDTPGPNSSNPGSAPIPGKTVQPIPTPLPEVTAAPAAQPAPMASATPAAAASPANSPGATPTPGTHEPGASPAGTP